MWFVTKPTAVSFDDLEKANRDVSACIYAMYIHTWTVCSYKYIMAN